MKYTTLPTTDIKVSRICLGTMTWGCQNSEDEAHEQMDYALDQGVNFWDTAELYAVPPEKHTQGLTEQYIGNWFAKTGRREDVVLASKVAGHGIGWIRNGQPITPAGIKDAVEGNLKRLQTDYIDLYQLHWPNHYVYKFGEHFNYGRWTNQEDSAKAQIEDMHQILETLGVLVKEGKLRHVGLSNDTAWGTMQYLRLAKEYDLPRMITVQNEYSLLCRLPDWDLGEVCAKEDIGFLAWSPLATGIISGKYLDGKIPAGTRQDHRKEAFRMTESTDKAVRAYLGAAEKHGLDVCQMAIAFTLTRPYMTASIIGATSMEQLKNNIEAIDVNLTPEILDDIHAVWVQYPMPY